VVPAPRFLFVVHAFTAKKMQTAFLIYRRPVLPRLSSLLLLLCLAAPALLADVTMDFTQGANDYRQQAVTLDVPVSKTLTTGVLYSQLSSDDTVAPIKTYAASLGIKLNDHWNLKGSVTDSPEANGARSSGWGTAASCSGGGDAIDWTFSLAANQSYSSEYWQSQTTAQHGNGKNLRTVTTTNSGWENLTQSNVTPSIDLDIFSVVSLACGYSGYSYDRNVNDFSNEVADAAGPVQYAHGNNLFSTSTDFGNLPPLMNGFPSGLFTAGIALSPCKWLKAGYDRSRTSYATDHAPVEASTFSLAYTVGSMIRARLGYSIFSTDETYVVTSLQWLW
jgi:hypothetical protein